MANMNIVETPSSQDGQPHDHIDGQRGRCPGGHDSDHAWARAASCVLLDKTRSVLRLRRPRNAARTPTRPIRRSCGRPSVWCSAPAPDRQWENEPRSTRPLSEVSNPTLNVMDDRGPGSSTSFPSINQIQTIRSRPALTSRPAFGQSFARTPTSFSSARSETSSGLASLFQSRIDGPLPVVSSLHATDSVSALHRFLDMGIARVVFSIASSVLAVVGQRLCEGSARRARRAAYQPSDEELVFL